MRLIKNIHNEIENALMNVIIITFLGIGGGISGLHNVEYITPCLMGTAGLWALGT